MILFRLLIRRCCRDGDVQLKRRVRPVSQHLRRTSTVEIKIQKWSRRRLPTHFFSPRPLAWIQLRGRSKISGAARSLGSLHGRHGWKCSSIERPVEGNRLRCPTHCSAAVEQDRSWISEGSLRWKYTSDQTSYKLRHVWTFPVSALVWVEACTVCLCHVAHLTPPWQIQKFTLIERLRRDEMKTVSTGADQSAFSSNRCLHFSSPISC